MFFRFPKFFDKYTTKEKFNDIPVDVIGIDQNNTLVSHRFVNLNEALKELPNLHREFAPPMKDIDPNDPERKRVCIRFESWKACDMLSR